MKSVLYEYASTTSSHGWGNATKQKTKLRKVVWIILSVAFTIASIVMVGKVIERYLQFDTKDKLMVSSEDLIFPSVTLCPLTSSTATSNRENSEIERMSETGEMSENEIVKQTQILIGLLQKFMDIELNITKLHEITLEHEIFYKNYYKDLLTNKGYFENVGYSEDFSLSRSTAIPVCKFKGENCQDEAFKTFYHPEYYSCYTFNGAQTNLKNSIITETGPKAGLSLILYLDDSGNELSLYSPDLPGSGSQGYRVVIHEQGTWPDPENNGFDIKPGHSVNAALSANRRELLKPPWGVCADHPDLEYRNFKYSRSACKKKCLQKIIYKMCGCIAIELPVDEETANASFCGKINMSEWLKSNPNISVLQSDLERLECFDRDWSGEEVAENCECKENCNYTMHDISLSSSSWPRRGVEWSFFCREVSQIPNFLNLSVFSPLVPKELCSTFSLSSVSNFSKEYGDDFRHNFIKLNIYFMDLDTKVTIQDEGFTFSSMVSEIGGNLGLFIGVSLISIIEFFVLIFGLGSVLGKMIVKSNSIKLEQNQHTLSLEK